jgi:IS4 transposase
MTNIIVLLTEIVNSSEKTMLRQMAIIIQAMLAMSGRVTMLGISRWAGKGGSYRTVQRFFNTRIDWQTLFYRFFLKHHHRSNATYILAGDESVITKAGTKTHGLDRFYAGLGSSKI